MSEPLGRRCALSILAALVLALLAGLLAWGPIPLDAAAHAYADVRAWHRLPNAGNVLACLPLLCVAAWGWSATRASRWGDELRRPWSGFHLGAASTAVLAAVYHVAPNDTAYLLAHATSAAAFVLLCAGVLAERVDARFGSAPAMIGAALLVAVALALTLLGTLFGAGIDLRPLVMLEALPVLLIPAGALGLRGAHTRTADWMVMLAAYAAAKAFDLADAAVLQATGWIGGHALMHLGMAAVAGWLAYCAADARAESAGPETRRQTSLNTSG